MAIYETSAAVVSRESSLSSSLSSSLTVVAKAMIGSPVLRMVYGADHDPYSARWMRTDPRKGTISPRTISFWVGFAVVALVYSQRTISVDVWQAIVLPKKKKKMSIGSNSSDTTPPTFHEGVAAIQVAVYAICRKMVQYAQNALKQQSQPREVRHDVSPTQHRGSCHCGAIQFVFFSAKTLYVEETNENNKINHNNNNSTTDGRYYNNRRLLPYRYARIDNTALTWEVGNVQSYDSRYFFCPRCGVSLAHATSIHNTTTDDKIQQLFINVDCLDGNSYILRPIHSRPPEATPSTLPSHIPLTVPIPTIVDHHHAMASDRVSTTLNTQQQRNHPSSSPSMISALDDELEIMSTMDDRITLTSAASVASGQTTEELAVTAYRLRKALSSHSSTTKSWPPRGVDTYTECDNDEDEDDDNNEVVVEEEDVSNKTPAAMSPALELLLPASIPLFHNDESSSTTTADAETLRRFLGKHVR